jgi:hypothetical protein
MTNDSRPQQSSYDFTGQEPNREQIVDGHLQWSFWTQKRLMHIGLPLAAFFALAFPLSFAFAQHSSGTVLTADQETSAASTTNDSQNLPENINNSTEAYNAPAQTPTTGTLTVNDDTIVIPENGIVSKTVNDVSGTTEILVKSKSSHTSTKETNINSNTLHIDIRAENGH